LLLAARAGDLHRIMTDLTPKDIASVSACYWACLNEVRLPTGIFSLKDHEYQEEPMEYKGKRLCYLKAAQSFGATTLEGLKDIQGMLSGKYTNGVAHVFPTQDEVGEFSKFFFKPLISRNKNLIGRHVRDTDTASLKKIRDAFLYLRGGRLSQKIGETDEDTSSKTAGFTIDRVVFDEIDFMDSAVIEKFKGRMYHSPVQEEVYLGNPSHEDYGIDVIFKQSDQRYWWRRCSCGEWTCAEKSFPECVKLRTHTTPGVYGVGQTARIMGGYIGCNKCGKEVPIWAGEGTGEWRPDAPENSDYMHGYHLSRLTNIFTDPADVLRDFENPPNDNLADVYRLQLGRAYSAESDKLRRAIVLACCGPDIMGNSHSGPCAMGVDVGKIKHVVIGVKIDNERYETVKVARCENFGEIHDLAKRFNVKSAVIDLRPYEETVRKFQREESYRMSLCEYSDTLIQETIWNDKTGIVKVHRTSIFDATHRLITDNKLTLPRQTPDIEQFAVQCCNCAKFVEKNKRTKQVVFRYRQTGDKKVGDHYRSALNYFLLAASGWRVGRVGSAKNRQKVADNNYARV